MKVLSTVGPRALDLPTALETVRRFLATDLSAFLSDERFRELQAASEFLAGAGRAPTDVSGRKRPR